MNLTCDSWCVAVRRLAASAWTLLGTSIQQTTRKLTVAY